MARVSVSEIQSAADDFFSLANDKSFVKSYTIADLGEREGILPAFKWFLAGRFLSVNPEGFADKKTRKRLDFVVGDTALEVAVRKAGKPKSHLKSSVNASEIAKLLKWDGPSVLVLFDFANSPLNDDELSDFRNYPSLGRGNHKVSAFNVVYVCRDSHGTVSKKQNIRI